VFLKRWTLYGAKKILGVKNTVDLAILIRYLTHAKFVVKQLKLSHSQISQDVFVLSELQKVKPMREFQFFVEFGATNGKELSNTYLLEKFYNWKGILVEPAKVWHDSLKENRNCIIDYRCVSSTTGERVPFVQSSEPVYSTLYHFSDPNHHVDKRIAGETYDIETITLNDLLEEHKAPVLIDYLSIDTEGSEYDILKNVNFSKWKFRIITVEHNYNANRKSIFDLLTQNGYERVLTNKTLMDDWYILTKRVHFPKKAADSISVRENYQRN